MNLDSALNLSAKWLRANRVFMVVSFIQWRGWQRLKGAFHELVDRRVPIHVLTTTYIGATDFRAIEELARLPNVQARISLDGRRRRLHAKAWLFQRDNGFKQCLRWLCESIWPRSRRRH